MTIDINAARTVHRMIEHAMHATPEETAHWIAGMGAAAAVRAARALTGFDPAFAARTFAQLPDAQSVVSPLHVDPSWAVCAPLSSGTSALAWFDGRKNAFAATVLNRSAANILFSLRSSIVRNEGT